MEFRCGTCEAEEEQPAIRAYYFRMEKKGGGWKTTGFFTIDDDKIPPLEWTVNEDVPKRYSTLSNIKKSFAECTPITYVMEVHLSAPSEIYQVVVKFRETSDWKERDELWKGVKESLFYDIHYNYKYVNDVPKPVMIKWTSF